MNVSNSAVAEPKRRLKVEPVEETELAPRYNLILLDDDDHSYDYVILMLVTLFGFQFQKAFQCAQEVDNQGRVILMTGSFEHCELKQEQIHGFGPDPTIARSAGAMSAIIEKI